MNAKNYKKKIKVLVEVDSADIKIGAINDMLDLARYSKNLGLNILLAGPINKQLLSVAEKLEIATIKRKSKPISKIGIIGYCISVLYWIYILLRYKPDILHLNFITWGNSSAFAARICRIPIVARAGGSHHRNNLSFKWIEKFVANCEQQAKGLMSSPVSDRVVIVGDLINLERFSSTGPLIEKLPKKEKKIPRILFIGQLIERKGIDILVKAVYSIKKKFELLIVGGDWDSPGYPNKIKKMIKNYGLNEKISLINYRLDAINIMKTCDIFV